MRSCDVPDFGVDDAPQFDGLVDPVDVDVGKKAHLPGFPRIAGDEAVQVVQGRFEIRDPGLPHEGVFVPPEKVQHARLHAVVLRGEGYGLDSLYKSFGRGAFGQLEAAQRGLDVVVDELPDALEYGGRAGGGPEGKGRGGRDQEDGG